ncbi:D-alanyl-D-alanine carboxypeptidase/D-alanyl-D-alanine-endopeptidase [Polycladomyces abyssicola]|nr:D-alanyl-D-alanine carboxypeptidase/D-alanyl-D-alanine-endopeptidase [Polycladomyces abyssicola]
MHTWRDRLDSLWKHWKSESGEKGAQIGCALFSLTRKEIYGHRDEEWMIPASNNKLWTSAVALERLGAEYRWHTLLEWTEDRWLIVGGGDPVFGQRQAEDLLAEIKKHGVRCMPGRIDWDDSAFPTRRWGTGWARDDLSEGYAAPVHAFNMELNRFSWMADPKEPAPRLRLPPSYETLPVYWRSHLSWTEEEESDVRMMRAERSNRFRIEGVLSRQDPQVTGAVWSPPHFFVERLRWFAKEQGLTVPETWTGRRRRKSGDPIRKAGVDSPPLKECLPLVNADSENLVAEILLHSIGRESSGKDYVEQGIQKVEQTLRRWGLEPPASYVDGSGLSMYNRSSPRQLCELLRFMVDHPAFSVFVESLAVYGQTGTLKKRNPLPPPITVRAKTGTLTGVKTLSGYLFHGRTPVYVFSLMVNGVREERSVENLQDAFLRLLADHIRREGN